MMAGTYLERGEQHQQDGDGANDGERHHFGSRRARAQMVELP